MRLSHLDLDRLAMAVVDRVRRHHSFPPGAVARTCPMRPRCRWRQHPAVVGRRARPAVEATAVWSRHHGDYTTRAGLFKARRRGDRRLADPRSELARDFLLVTQIARTTLGVGYGGQAVGNRVVRWERRDNKVLLRTASFRHHGGLIAADLPGGARRELLARSSPASTSSRTDRQRGRDRRLATVHQPAPRARARTTASRCCGRTAQLRRARGIPRCRSRGDAHVRRSHATAGAGYTGANAAASGQGAPPGAASVLMHWSMVRLPRLR